MYSINEQSISEKNNTNGSSITSRLLINDLTKDKYQAKSSVSNTIEQSYQQAIKEKIFLSFYSALGIQVPDSVVLKLPICDSHKNQNDDLFSSNSKQKNSYYICTNLAGDKYSDHLMTVNHKPIMKLLAAGLILNDIDSLGYQMNNVRVIMSDKQQIVSLYKIDAGECFSNCNFSQIGRIRIMSQGSEQFIKINKLPTNMKKYFYHYFYEMIAYNEEDLLIKLKQTLPVKFYNEHKKLIFSFMVTLQNRIIGFRQMLM